MTSEVEERPRLVTAGYEQHRSQWVNSLDFWRWKFCSQHVSVSINPGCSGDEGDDVR